VISPTDLRAFDEEQIKRIVEADQIDQMVQSPAWKWWEDRLTEIVDHAKREVLEAPTYNAQVSADTLRKYQLTDEIVSTLRAEIIGRLSERDELVSDPKDQMAVILKEQLNDRISTSGNPARD
jgi:hypothetical protein